MLATAGLGAWSKKLLICWFINNSSMTIAATTRIAYEPINAYLSGGGLQIRPTLGLVKPTIDIISNVLAKSCGTDLLELKMFLERSSTEPASSQYTLYYFYHFPPRENHKTNTLNIHKNIPSIYFHIFSYVFTFKISARALREGQKNVVASTRV